MIIPLKREDWDFSGLSNNELLPALLWEMRRERDDLEYCVTEARAWLEGKKSERRPPMPKDKRTGKRPRYNSNFSEADTARIRATSGFQYFIPFGEVLSLHKGNAKERRAESDRWLASYLRPLLKNYNKPWQCLSEAERRRLCAILDRIRDRNVVYIGSWWDAVGMFKKDKPDAYQPLKFDFSEYTSVLLTISWRSSRKRILATIGNILKQLEPPGIKHLDRRGKKDRDLLVTLERLAVMRLLHHYTLSEIKRLLPDAWKLYQNRKWYDDRRQALKDFRSSVWHRDAEKFFPECWQTKAQRLRKAS